MGFNSAFKGLITDIKLQYKFPWIILLRKPRKMWYPLIIIFVGYSEDGGGKLLRNDGAGIHTHVALCHRSQVSLSEHEISQLTSSVRLHSRFQLYQHSTNW